MNARCEKILQLLLSAKQAITSEEISLALQVSSKTVRNDLKDLQPLLLENHIKLTSIRGKGYELLPSDKEKVTLLLEQQALKASPIEPENRVYFLMEKLLLQTTYTKLEDMADELFISRSSLQGDLRQVREILSDYNLALKQKPNYGIKVIGDEMQIRFCIAEWLYQQDSSVLRGAVDLDILPEKDLQTIKNSILTNLRKNQILISDISLQNLITHVAIAVRRLGENQAIGTGLDYAHLKNEKEYIVARKIVDDIEDTLQITFPVNEVAYLAMHLLGTRLVSPNEKVDRHVCSMDPAISELVEKMVERIDNQYGFQLKEDMELRLALALHLKPAINRYHYQMNIRNPLLDEIKLNYPLSFEAALIGSEVLNEIQSIKLVEDEVAYLALHLEVAQERRKQEARNKQRCLIVCASGMGSAQLLTYKLKDLFHEEIVIAGTTEMHNLKHYALDEIDFIITTIPLLWDPGIPVIQVSTILGKADIFEVKGMMKRNNQVIRNYFLEPFTYFRKEFTKTETILRFLCNDLERLGLVDSNYLDSVLQREAYASTSFGNLVAIPHPLEPQTDRTFWSVMTLVKPIEWGDKPVQLIFLLNASKDRQHELKPMFEEIGNLLEDQHLIRRLVAARNFNEFKRLMGIG
ncbi:cellobiose operon transcriptional regulator [Oceanobacillus picturae]|uniref:Cellobiose operon transcriptional regulator n=1 Tax=Oceanobacillus picturae TaxID=171693 RepID=A0A0U9H9F7_9BACI|nr:BglG family transcription antiterminator [Oceanobacillus picturae]GAQ18672.1 cellobiose operon transcriptional regulator [Oceanobacillus picturae]